MVQFPDKCEWQNGITQTTKGAWSGTQLGPRIIQIQVLGVEMWLQKERQLQSWTPHHDIPG